MNDTPIRECHFCGHHFESHLGKYRGAGRDCPNCQADGLLATDVELLATCIYPECNCPFDMGRDDRCLRGLPPQRKGQ